MHFKLVYYTFYNLLILQFTFVQRLFAIVSKVPVE